MAYLENVNVNLDNLGYKWNDLHSSPRLLVMVTNYYIVCYVCAHRQRETQLYDELFAYLIWDATYRWSYRFSPLQSNVNYTR